jgi:hypothetical protein
MSCGSVDIFYSFVIMVGEADLRERRDKKPVAFCLQ